MVALIGYGLVGIVAAIGVVALLVLVLPRDHLAVAPRDVVPAGLPAGPEIGGDDVARVRLPVTLRGYRMVDTDAVLDRLAVELERRDHEIEDLRRAAGLPPRASMDAPDPVTRRPSAADHPLDGVPADSGPADPEGFAADDEVLAGDCAGGASAWAGEPPPRPIAGSPHVDDAAHAARSPR